MLPLDLFRSPTVRLAVIAGFAFMVGYYGLPFVMSLYLQELRGLSALDTGIAFLPMMLIGGALTPFTARLAERFGARALITAGLASMTAGLIVISLLPGGAPVAVLAAAMMLVGLAGPLVMPPVIALLLHAVPARRAGVASGVLNTSRQAGGALAIAVFGALLADRGTFLHGLQVSLIIVAAVAAATELRISTRRSDGTLRAAVPIWVVHAGEGIYVRSYRGTGGGWFRRATARGAARNTAASAVPMSTR
jgi:MFS transporter, DHA2 family, methylenomycin A resistance protein